MSVVRQQTYYLPLDERTGLNRIQHPSLGKSTTPIFTEGICCAKCLASCGFKTYQGITKNNWERFKSNFFLQKKQLGEVKLRAYNFMLILSG